MSNAAHCLAPTILGLALLGAPLPAAGQPAEDPMEITVDAGAPSDDSAEVTVRGDEGTGDVATATPEHAEPPTAAAEASAPDSAAASGAPSDGPVGGATAEPAPSAEAPPPAEVEVRAARRVGGSAHVLRAADLERFEADDPHRALQMLPGVYVRVEDGAGLRPNIGIRGAASDRSKKLTLMEDGVLLGPAPYSAPAAYYFPVMTRIRSVQVLKGPSAITAGPHTVGGALELRSAEIPATPSGMLDVALGQFWYGKIHGRYGFSTERVGVLVEGVHLRSDGFKELDGGGDTGFYRNEWVLEGRYTIGAASPRPHDLELKLGYSDEASNETYLGLSDEDFAATPLRRYAASARDRMEWHRTAIELTHRVRRSTFEVATTAYRHDLDRSWNKVNAFGTFGSPIDPYSVLQDPGRYPDLMAVLAGEQDSVDPSEQILIGPNDRTFVSQGVQTELTLRGRTGPVRHLARWGLRLHEDSVRRLHTQEAWVMRGGTLEQAASPSPVETTRSDEDETIAVAAFVSDEVSYGPLTLTPGLRFELVHWRTERFADDPNAGGVDGRPDVLSDDYAVLLPGLGTVTELFGGLALVAGVHRGFSPVAPGTPGAEPETSINYEGGLRWAAPKRLQGSRQGPALGPLELEALGFYNDYQNLTAVCTFATGCADDQVDRQYDAGRAAIYGLEAFGRAEPRLGRELRLPMLASYSLTFAEFRESFDSDNPQWGSVVAGDDLPYVPRNQLFASLALEAPRWGGALSVTWVSPMREEAGAEPYDESLMTDEQVLLDLGGHYSPAKRVKLYGQLRNLLAQEYLASRRPFGARPTAPFTALFGVKLEL